MKHLLADLEITGVLSSCNSWRFKAGDTVVLELFLPVPLLFAWDVQVRRLTGWITSSGCFLGFVTATRKQYWNRSHVIIASVGALMAAERCGTFLQVSDQVFYSVVFISFFPRRLCILVSNGPLFTDIFQLVWAGTCAEPRRTTTAFLCYQDEGSFDNRWGYKWGCFPEYE